MARLWLNNPETPEGKYLVKRRDGTIPRWPHFVLAASDPAAPAALRAYADSAEANNFDPAFVADIRSRADDFEAWRAANGAGDPDAPPPLAADPAPRPRGRGGGGGGATCDG